LLDREGPEGSREKNLQKIDNVVGSQFVGIRSLHVKESDSLSFKDYLISAIILVNNLGAGPSGREVISLQKVNSLLVFGYNGGAKKVSAKRHLRGLGLHFEWNGMKA
jgi:hypothetical protein